MNIKPILAALLAALTVSTATVTATAAEPVYGPIPNGFTMTIDVGDSPVVFSSPTKPIASAAQNQQQEAAELTQIDLAAYAAEMLHLVNGQREQAGLESLQSDPALTEMAQQRAKEISSHFSHTRPDGSNCFSVFDEYDINLKPDGENISGNHRSPEQAVHSLMNSPGHRKNILKESALYLGIGVYQDDAGNLTWVQIFAK